MTKLVTNVLTRNVINALILSRNTSSGDGKSLLHRIFTGLAGKRGRFGKCNRRTERAVSRIENANYQVSPIFLKNANIGRQSFRPKNYEKTYTLFDPRRCSVFTNLYCVGTNDAVGCRSEGLGTGLKDS